MPFRPGQSGNPSGRPKDLHGIKALCQERSVQALDIVTKIMRNKKAKTSDRLKAADMILDRAYGKPLQEVKGVQVNLFTQTWNGAIQRAANVGRDGRVHIRTKKKGKA